MYLDYKIDYKEKLRRILARHRVKMVTGKYETMKEYRLVMYATWLKYEINSLGRTKMSKRETREMYYNMISLVDLLYKKYFDLNGGRY